jgi:type VI secretion system secreted protein Hcp
MIMIRNSLLLVGILLLFCSSTSFAQTYYLKIGDIEGESTERAHKDWIIYESFSQGLEQAQSASGAARQRGSVVLNDLIIIKKLDKATPMLMEI